MGEEWRGGGEEEIKADAGCHWFLQYHTVHPMAAAVSLT